MTIRDRIVLYGAEKALSDATENELADVLKNAYTYDPAIINLAKEKYLEKSLKRLEDDKLPKPAERRSKLIKCPQCNELIEADIQKCPICKTIEPGKLEERGCLEKLGICTAVIVVLIILGVFVSSERPNRSETKQGIKYGDWNVAIESLPAFLYEDDIIKLENIARSNDDEAGVAFLAFAVTSGRAIMIEKGTEVYVITSRRGRLRVRRRGDLNEYWCHRALLE
jgi:hypothetical protein